MRHYKWPKHLWRSPSDYRNERSCKRIFRTARVNRVSITVEQGSVVGLLGPNGAGKTTTFYMIVGIERPDEGVVTLDGDDISSLAMYERARAGIGYLPQEAFDLRK